MPHPNATHHSPNWETSTKAFKRSRVRSPSDPVFAPAGDYAWQATEGFD